MTSVVISIVSHGQGNLVANLLNDLEAIVNASTRVLITLNVPEDESFLSGLRFKPLVIRNDIRKGFGANHNAAFRIGGQSDVFMVVNPDVRCDPTVVTKLADVLSKTHYGAVAPVVTSPAGHIEDSARRYPTIPRISSRAIQRLRGEKLPPDYELRGKTPVLVEWFAGMFMVFASGAFSGVGGFDERYFMYLEDADICRRLQRLGYQCAVLPDVKIIHDAQRATTRSLRHLSRHLSSFAKFLRA